MRGGTGNLYPVSEQTNFKLSLLCLPMQSGACLAARVRWPCLSRVSVEPDLRWSSPKAQVASSLYSVLHAVELPLRSLYSATRAAE